MPIAPFYLSYLAGVGIKQITSEAEISPAVRRRAVISAVFFAAGAITIFMGLGAGGWGLGAGGWGLGHPHFANWCASGSTFCAGVAAIIIMGLQFLGILKIAILCRQIRADTGQTS